PDAADLCDLLSVARRGGGAALPARSLLRPSGRAFRPARGASDAAAKGGAAEAGAPRGLAGPCRGRRDALRAEEPAHRHGPSRAWPLPVARLHRRLAGPPLRDSLSRARAGGARPPADERRDRLRDYLGQALPERRSARYSA